MDYISKAETYDALECISDKYFIINVLESFDFSRSGDAKKQYVIKIFMCFLSIKGRINFLQPL